MNHDLPADLRPTVRVPAAPPLSEEDRLANQLRRLAQAVAEGRADPEMVRGLLEGLEVAA